MRRRDFFSLLGGAAAWPLAARAQQLTAAPTIGFLTIGLTTQMLFVDGFRRGLKEVGFVEGQNVNIEYRSAENDYDRLPSLVDELIRQHVALIFANSSTRRRWPPKLQPPRYPSFSRWVWTRSNTALLQASRGRVATSPA